MSRLNTRIKHTLMQALDVAMANVSADPASYTAEYARDLEDAAQYVRSLITHREWTSWKTSGGTMFANEADRAANRTAEDI